MGALIGRSECNIIGSNTCTCSPFDLLLLWAESMAASIEKEGVQEDQGKDCPEQKAASRPNGGQKAQQAHWPDPGVCYLGLPAALCSHWDVNNLDTSVLTCRSGTCDVSSSSLRSGGAGMRKSAVYPVKYGQRVAELHRSFLEARLSPCTTNST